MFDTILNDLDEDTTSLHVGSEINSDKSIDSEEDDDLVELDDASDSDDADDLKDDESLAELVERRVVVRRSGADVSDADGRDSAADAAAGNRAGQADRD